MHVMDDIKEGKTHPVLSDSSHKRQIFFFPPQIEQLNRDLDVTKVLASLGLAGCWLGELVKE